MIRNVTLSSLALVSFFVGRSSAAVSIESSTFTNIAIGSAPFLVDLNKFDPALGTLQKIEFKLELFDTNAGTLTFDNESGCPTPVTLNLGVEVAATVDGSRGWRSMRIELDPSTRGTGMAGADSDRSPDFTGSDIFSITSGVLSDSGSVFRTKSKYLSQFTAQGNSHTFQTTISNLRTMCSSAITGQMHATGGTFSGRISAIYTYCPLPIPEGGTAYFGILLGVFASTRRYRMRTNSSRS